MRAVADSACALPCLRAVVDCAYAQLCPMQLLILHVRLFPRAVAGIVCARPCPRAVADIACARPCRCTVADSACARVLVRVRQKGGKRVSRGELHLTETQCSGQKINDVAKRIFQNEAKDKNKEDLPSRN